VGLYLTLLETSSLNTVNVGPNYVCCFSEYFIIGEEVILNNVIDREDVDLFPDQSNTDIILQLEVNCESDTGISMSSDLRNIS
jgi:hypothetical protein